MQQTGGLKAALSKAASLQPSRSASDAEEWTDPLSIAAMELMQRDQLISQTSAIASALQVRAPSLACGRSSWCWPVVQQVQGTLQAEQSLTRGQEWPPAARLSTLLPSIPGCCWLIERLPCILQDALDNTEEDCQVKGAIMDSQALTTSHALRNAVRGQICTPPKVLAAQDCGWVLPQISRWCSSASCTGQCSPAVCVCNEHVSCAAACWSRCAVQIESYTYYQQGDPSLAAYLAAVPSKPCAGCSDGPAIHLATWLHGDSLLAFSFAQLPADQALPGADHGQIWFWTRRHEASPCRQQLADT